MKYVNRLIITVISLIMLVGMFVIVAPAQKRGTVSVSGRTQRPIIIRRVYYRPFWRYNYWGGFYDPYWNSPYLRYKDQEYYLRRDLEGNQRELRKHQEKYRADGQLTAKEREELADDVRDVRRSRKRLNDFRRNY